MSDVPMTLKYDDETIKIIPIEVSSVKEFSLNIKIKASLDIESLNLDNVVEIKIEAKNPAFLISELRDEFLKLNKADNYDMKNNLPSNVEFVFGPPGTGKTTYLANEIINELIAKNEKIRILVLTPTNKAADVITERIMSSYGNDVPNWLVRFGTTNSNIIEEKNVFKDRSTDIRTFDKSVVATTIVRVPYDYFMLEDERIYLKDMNWDYIVIDEASMISLAYITYVLHIKKPIKFIVAGDPFQIEPITLCELWKNENIYKMVELNSFANPKTVPHKYNVKLLTTQYRSIPSVGTIFSELAYNGILKHFRSENQKKDIDFGGKIELGSLNLIKYPTSNFESIYKPKRLQSKTPYHIYSAIFVNEFVMFLSKLIAKNNDKQVTIGVVAPYRAQANIIEKMLMVYKVPDNIKISVGTIHGFQGDEADILIAVFNAPPTISNSPDLFLNRLNIVNVAVSRARDCLIVIMPDNATPNIGELTLVKKVERYILSNQEHKEYSAKELEELMFHDIKYIEDNTFVTTHQSINVYSQSDKKYEIRAEDYAIDVQLTFNKNGGIKVFNDKYGEGIIINTAPNNEGAIVATVLFKDGNDVKYSLNKALSSGTLKIIA